MDMKQAVPSADRRRRGATAVRGQKERKGEKEGRCNIKKKKLSCSGGVVRGAGDVLAYMIS